MDDLGVRTMHAFISRALQKILLAAPKKHTQLRQACIEVIGARSTASRLRTRPVLVVGSSESPSAHAFSKSSAVRRPLRLSCQRACVRALPPPLCSASVSLCVAFAAGVC